MMVQRTDLAVWRCPACSRILAKLRLGPGSVVEIKCKSCSAFSVREAPEREVSATLATATS